MPRLSRLLRLFAVTVLVITGTCVVVPNATAGEDPRELPPLRFDHKALVEVCDHYQGRYLEDLPRPYRYGCTLSDGDIMCEETGACTFFRLAGDLPFQESCERAGDKFIWERLDIFRCLGDKEREPVVLYCEPKWETCAIGHEQPMP